MFTDKYTIILDCNYLCWRSMLKLKGLSYDNYPTGVIYGFLRQVQILAERFNHPKFIFTWDSKRSYRKETLPTYKTRPPSDDPELIHLYKIGKPQFDIIRTIILPKMGFKNILLQTGLEADDMIAKFIQDYWNQIDDKIVIISRDEDLYQLLTSDVSMYDPLNKEFYTENDFIQEKGIPIKDWPFVKAVGGCVSDTIPGLSNVAEKTVLQYLKGTLKSGKRMNDIKSFDPTFNYTLVKLPHFKTKPIKIEKDELTIDTFEGICLDYGFHSFLKKENYMKWKRILKKDN